MGLPTSMMLVWLMGAAGVWGFGAPDGADVIVPVKPSAPVTVDAALAMMDSRDLAERERGMDLLSRTASFTVTEAIALLGRDELSEEQRERLVRLGWEKFARSSRAALGVRFQISLMRGAEGGAIVDEAFAGFDSHRVLRAGDVIYAMDESRIRTMEDGKRVIQSREPGERVTLRIFRKGEGLIVPVVLGRLDELPKGPNEPLRSGDAGVLVDAYRLRLERDLGERFGRARVLDLAPFFPTRPVAPSRLDVPRMVAVVATKPEITTEGILNAELQDVPTIVGAGGRQGLIGDGHFAPFSANTPVHEGRYQAAMRRIAQMQKAMNQANRIFLDRNMPMAERQRAWREQQEISGRIEVMRKELERLKQERLEP